MIKIKALIHGIRRLVTKPNSVNGSSRRKLWLTLLVSSTCESRCKPWV